MSSLPALPVQALPHPAQRPPLASFAVGPTGMFPGGVEAYAELGLRNWDRLAAQHQRTVHEAPSSPPTVMLYDSNSAPPGRSPNANTQARMQGGGLQRSAWDGQTSTPPQWPVAQPGGGVSSDGPTFLGPRDLAAVAGSAGGFRDVSCAKDSSTGASLGHAWLPHPRPGGENVAGNCADAPPHPKSSDEFARAGALLFIFS